MATVVAQRLGYLPETTLTLGRFVAGSGVCAKARHLGIVEEAQEAEERHARAAEFARRQTVRLLGRDILGLAAADGTLRAEDDRKPASAKSVRSYIVLVFGNRLAKAQGATEALSAPTDCLLSSMDSIHNATFTIRQKPGCGRRRKCGCVASRNTQRRKASSGRSPSLSGRVAGSSIRVAAPSRKWPPPQVGSSTLRRSKRRSADHRAWAYGVITGCPLDNRGE